MPKIINTSHTTDTIGLPFLARSVDWLQEKTDDQDLAIIQSVNQNTSTAEVWQLYYKNIRTTGGGVWLWDEGAVLYNGKIYLSPGGTVTLGGGETLYYYFIATAQAGEPTTYTDNSTFQTNENITIGICKNTENVSQQIEEVNLLRYINLEKSLLSASDLYWKLVKRGNVWTFTFYSTLGNAEPRNTFTILENFNGNFISEILGLLPPQLNFPCNLVTQTLDNYGPDETYIARLYKDGTTLKANIRSGTGGSISWIG